MGWFKKKAEERAEVLDESSGAALITSLIRGDSMSKEMALQIPAVAACVNLIADRITSLPVRLYDNSGGSITEVTDDVRVRFLNRNTGDTLTGSEMIRNWVGDYFLDKGA